MRKGPIAALVSLVVILSACTGSSTTSTEAAETHDPVPASPEELIAEGVYEGSETPWTMKAFDATNGSLCIELAGTGCVAVDTSQPSIALLKTEDGIANSGCAYGYVFGSTTVLVTLATGSVIEVPIHSHPAFEVDFYAYCGAGDLRPLTAALPEDT